MAGGVVLCAARRFARSDSTGGIAGAGASAGAAAARGGGGVAAAGGAGGTSGCDGSQSSSVDGGAAPGEAPGGVAGAGGAGGGASSCGGVARALRRVPCGPVTGCAASDCVQGGSSSPESAASGTAASPSSSPSNSKPWTAGAAASSSASSSLSDDDGAAAAGGRGGEAASAAAASSLSFLHMHVSRHRKQCFVHTEDEDGSGAWRAAGFFAAGLRGASAASSLSDEDAGGGGRGARRAAGFAAGFFAAGLARARFGGGAAASPSLPSLLPSPQGRSLDRIASQSVSLLTCAAILAGAIWSRMKRSGSMFVLPSSRTPLRGGQGPVDRRPAFVGFRSHCAPAHSAMARSWTSSGRPRVRSFRARWSSSSA